MIAPNQSTRRPEFFYVVVTRCDAPGQRSYAQKFRLPYEPGLNVISVLQKIAANPQTADDEQTTPVVWDSNCLEEVCGACTMVVNGRVRQACSALIDNLLEDGEDTITLAPMTKFPVVRDLMVDRSRLFRALTKVKAWAPVDGYFFRGPGPRQSSDDQQETYPLSQCMSCGCCVDACPQYGKVELKRRPDESDADFEARKNAAYDREFVGPHAISQAVLFNTIPTGKMLERERLDALTAEGGIQICGNAQNCVAVCPKEIPLTRSIARAGRSTTLHAIKKIFDF